MLSLLVTQEEKEVNQVHKGEHTVGVTVLAKVGVRVGVAVAVVAFAVGAFCKSI
jgi:hypothetical protein